MSALTERAYMVPMGVITRLPDHRSRMALVAYAREVERTEAERLRVKAERDAARARTRREKWDEDPYVATVLTEARREVAALAAAGHMPGYWSAPCVECDRTKPTAVHQCRSCGRYNTRRGQP